VFPIQNSPPTIRFNQFELPPSETFSIFSFSWEARDPEGETNIDRIEVSFNDSTRFIALPGATRFATFVGQIGDPNQSVVDARFYAGRGFQGTGVFVPGLRLNEENVFYLRAVDQTDTASVRLDFTWRVTRPTGDILYVNDYRKSFDSILQRYHIGLLREFMPADVNIDVFNIAEPFFTGSSGVNSRSTGLPPVADPTLRQTLALYDHIYWVSTNTTNAPTANNMPFVAPVLDLFFENGGTLMVHSPVALPTSDEANDSNPAILLLPINQLITIPDTLRPSLRVPTNSPITPTGSLLNLPPLVPNRLLINSLPFLATGNNIALYDATFRYQALSGLQGDWAGPRTIASISEDHRVALMALPLIDERNGDPILVGADGTDADTKDAMFQLLDALGFPRR
jgi:hypothetical protein